MGGGDSRPGEGRQGLARHVRDGGGSRQGVRQEGHRVPRGRRQDQLPRRGVRRANSGCRGNYGGGGEPRRRGRSGRRRRRRRRGGLDVRNL
ncbi:unnamed protein product [Linum tenue]|uniref:Uncharacterized protein n=1 Tax=Linum tenue TaxID=586396 RepID=A0AAV0RAV6_9ROSI|nr:unnamed protein product [Linum tenue]